MKARAQEKWKGGFKQDASEETLCFPQVQKLRERRRGKILEDPRDSGRTLGPQATVRECHGTRLYVEYRIWFFSSPIYSG